MPAVELEKRNDGTCAKLSSEGPCFSSGVCYCGTPLLINASAQGAHGDDGSTLPQRTEIVDPGLIEADSQDDGTVSDGPDLANDEAFTSQIDAGEAGAPDIDAEGPESLSGAAAGSSGHNPDWAKCLNGDLGKYIHLYDFDRPNDHPRMSGNRAVMYCGRNDRDADEARFGFKHVAAGHKADFVELAQLSSEHTGKQWGYEMVDAIWDTLKNPGTRYVQSAERFCYQRKFIYRNANGQNVDKIVVVILGETGVRIITSFTTDKVHYCRDRSDRQVHF